MKKMILACALALLSAAVIAVPQAPAKAPAKAEAKMLTFKGQPEYAGCWSCTVTKNKGELTVASNAKGSDWGGFYVPLNAKSPLELPGWSKGNLVFEIKLADAAKPLTAIQVSPQCRGKGGKSISDTAYVVVNKYFPKTINARDFTKVTIPLKIFVWKTKHPITVVNFQYSGSGCKCGKFTIRNIRFELPEK